MIAFLDDHRGVFGVGPICRVLGIAPSTFYTFKAVERDPALACERARQDRLDMAAIKQIFDGSRGRYGARKVWHQLRREGRDIARCTVERLMKVMGLQGVVRGRPVITTNPDAAQPCPDDKVNRAFVAQMPNRLRVSDFSLMSPAGRAWCRSGRSSNRWRTGPHLSSSTSSPARSSVGASRPRWQPGSSWMP